MTARRRSFLLPTLATLFALGCSGGGDEGDDPFTPDDPSDDAPWSLRPDVPPLTGGTWYRPDNDVTWQWQLQGTVNTAYEVGLYDFDFEQPASLISELHGKGARVMCYFSAGSGESWRPDFSRIPANALGEPLAGWEGERYLDIRRKEVYDLMLTRLQASAAKGCDAVELDNVESFEATSGFPLSRDDQLAFNRNLANEAHRLGMGIALKNGGSMVADLVSYYDLELNEECHAFGECDALAPFVAAGKAVLNAEYTETEAEARTLASTVCPAAATEGLRTLILPLDLDDSFRVACDD